MKKYKLSQFNVFRQYDEETVIVCNLIEKKIFGLDSKKYNLLLQNSQNLSILQNENPHLFSALIKLGVIVDNEIDEINRIVLIHRKQIYNNHTYRITVLPTLDCNFRCWYCYEEHCKDYMTSSTQKIILKHVRKIINEFNIKHLALDWFGGEPLLCFEDTVFPLSRSIKRECEKRQILFSNSITTNGALITPLMIKRFRTIGLNSFQITLDGDEEHHNKTKTSKNKRNEYRNLLNTFFGMIDSVEDFNLLVRINYSPQNIDSIRNIINDIPQEYRRKMCVSFQQVWQTQHESLEYKIKDIVNCFIAEGFNVDKPNIYNGFYKCYADIANQIVIAPNGTIFKCTARDFTNHPADGVLKTDGSIQWNAPYFDRLCKTTIENDDCIHCRFLPACWGPCSQKLLEYRKDEFEKICNREGVRKTIESQMSDFYEINIRQQAKE